MKPIAAWIIVSALAGLAACAAPDNQEKGSYSGHAAFIERAKAGW
jgi:hypothetical protein